jgi:hypothetical protein
MTELRICRPEKIHFCLKTYYECITKWSVKDLNLQNDMIKANLQICARNKSCQIDDWGRKFALGYVNEGLLGKQIISLIH